MLHRGRATSALCLATWGGNSLCTTAKPLGRSAAPVAKRSRATLPPVCSPAQQRGEHWPITFYTQQAETIRLVEEQLAAVARDSQPAQEGAAAPLTDATQDGVSEGDAMRIARYRNTRYWAVIDIEDTLVCLCVYRKGALEVVRRLEARTTE